MLGFIYSVHDRSSGLLEAQRFEVALVQGRGTQLAATISKVCLYIGRTRGSPSGFLVRAHLS